ncbi:MAG TPA: 50S ribosomal protein L11 methyltransferase [Rhizomicrobium sp.]|jgi:predicted nicotinamide N-methyase|nr:50S ribosomal protein L11 methyltransferase [Rhizomicrobium sp.]
MTPEDFIKANAVVGRAPLVPEIKLYLASEVVSLWRATEEELASAGLPPPYWAFAWAGGQALARYVLDHPVLVRGKRVLDIGAGSGLVGLAALKAGAADVLAADIDAFACAAIRLNAAANDCLLTVTQNDLIGTVGVWDVILIGDLFYERPLAERLLAWLESLGALALLGDPGRTYFPKSGVRKLVSYSVQTPRDLEDREIRETGVYRLAFGD